MMPISTFNILLVVFILLVLYSWVDHRNKIYANIAAAIVSIIIGGLLSILIFIGAVQDASGVDVSDFPTAALIIFVTAVIAVYAFFMVMDAKEEYEKGKVT